MLHNTINLKSGEIGALRPLQLCPLAGRGCLGQSPVPDRSKPRTQIARAPFACLHIVAELITLCHASCRPASDRPVCPQRALGAPTPTKSSMQVRAHAHAAPGSVHSAAAKTLIHFNPSLPESASGAWKSRAALTGAFGQGAGSTPEPSCLLCISMPQCSGQDGYDALACAHLVAQDQSVLQSTLAVAGMYPPVGLPPIAAALAAQIPPRTPTSHN